MQGRIDVLGQEVFAMSEHELLAHRRQLGFVFQEGALFDSITVFENVAYGLREERVAEEEIESRVLEALRFVELSIPGDAALRAFRRYAAAYRLRGRWPPGRRSCFMIRQRPGSIRSRRKRSLR